MKSQVTSPTGTEQRFEVNETFFSLTDLKGQIVAGNEIFSRTSGYTFPELIGSPHNIVRHPDMPRCIFHVLWQETLKGRSFFGYVKNHAKNGNHYWVFALTEPIGEQVLSIRIKPTSAILSQIERLYAKLLSIEEDAISNGRKPKEAIALSLSKLTEEMTRFGFEAYSEFSYDCLLQEIKSRDELIYKQGLELFPQIINKGEVSSLSNSRTKAITVYKRLQTVFLSLGEFLSASERIKGESLAIQKIAIHFRHFALNANIVANPLGHKGATIGTITQFLHAHAAEFSSNSKVLLEQTIGTIESVTKISSHLVSARIQLEIQISFLIELANKQQCSQGGGSPDTLQKSLAAPLLQTIAAFRNLERWLSPLKRKRDELLRSIISFNVAQIAGLMECSRASEMDNLTTMFTDLRSSIEEAKKELTNSDEIINKLEKLAKTTPHEITQLLNDLQRSHSLAECTSNSA